MRIAIDARYLTESYSGVSRYSENLLTNLSRLDCENKYFVFVHRSFNRRLKVGENFKIIRAPGRPMSLWTFFSFGRLVRRQNCDFLHCLAPIAPLFGVPRKILTIHDIRPFNLEETNYRSVFGQNYLASLIYRITFPKIITSAQWLITVSHATRERLMEIFPETRHDMLAIHSGVSESFFVPPEATISQMVVKKLDLPQRFVLYLGSAQPNKNLPMMISAFHQVCKKYPDKCKALKFIFVVGGDRRFHECTRLIRQLDMQDQVLTLGPITEEENRVLLGRARLLFSVTSGEGFGFPILEAQAAGLPVLAADDAATPEVAGSAALLVDPNDFEAVTENLAKLLFDEDLRKQLSVAGIENARQFNWEKTAERILELYRLLM